MDIISDTPFWFGCIAGRLDFPKHSLTLIIKGTFALKPDGTAAALEQDDMMLLTGDEHFADDEEKVGSLWYGSDFAYFKPRADLLAVGACHPPEGPTASCPVRFGVGRQVKALNVIGDRPSGKEPQPFARMELRYERSVASKENPVGTGAKPNVEDPKRPKAPAGFGPLAPGWKERSAKVGTYKGRYMEERWPWFPKDFDWGYYCAAPSDLQVEGYLRGDEELVAENLHAEQAQYRCKLPGLRVRCFVTRDPLRGEAVPAEPPLTVDFTPEQLRARLDAEDSSAPEEIRARLEPLQFTEVPLRLDTLWADMEAERLVLVWRGFTPVEDEEYEDLEHTFYTVEPIADEPRSVAQCRERFIERYLELYAEEEEEAIEAEAEAGEAALSEEEQKQLDYLAMVEAKSKEQFIAFGVDPDNPPPPSEEEIELEKKIMASIDMDEPGVESELTREDVIARAAAGESFANEDLSELDLSELELKGVNFDEATLGAVNFSGSDLSGASFVDAQLENAKLPGCNLRGAKLTEADFTGADLSEADLSGAILDDAIFEQAILKDAKLDGASGAETYFMAAQLTGASLRGCQLEAADFSGALLNRACFQGASLKEASIEGAIGIEVDMSKADLTALRASEEPVLIKADFRGSIAPESTWETANLGGARFGGAKLQEADFTKAQLDGANFFAADCREAVFRKASLRTADFQFMNAMMGSFEKADLTYTNFTGANLYAAEFLEAIIDNTILETANLELTKLAGGKRGKA